MKNGESMFIGMALGAGLMYFFDPDRGSRRRALMRDQFTHAGHELEDTAVRTARRIRNRSRGLAYEARATLLESNVDDRVLIERVRSELGRAVSNAGAIEVDAHDGHVRLSGNVPSDEVQPLVRCVKSVRGVTTVDDRLSILSDTRAVPELQGALQH
jgi:osmotically-inducible protein OsmY